MKTLIAIVIFFCIARVLQRREQRRAVRAVQQRAWLDSVRFEPAVGHEIGRRINRSLMRL